jgi:hypothetical protein
MAGGMWFYVQRVLIPYQMADAARHSRPRGILSDLYPRWVGTRELLLNHRDPYGPAVTREIQTGYYGRPLDPQRAEDPKDEQRFAYPIYVVFLLSPTIGMSFASVQAALTWILAIVTAAGLVLWLMALRWRPPQLVSLILAILTLGSFAVLQGLKLQQLSLLVAALMAGCAALLAVGQLFLAGAVLAVATIKPQLVVLPVAWLLLWTLSKWKERRNFLWGFLLTGGLLAAGGACLQSDWLSRFVEGLAAYNRYTGGRSLLDELATSRGGALLTVLFLLGAAMVGWRSRRALAGSREFNLTLAFVLAVTLVVAPMVAPYNQVLLLPAIFLITRSWQSLYQRSSLTRLLCGAAALILFWPWLAALALALASAILPAASVQRAWAVPLWSSLEIPLTVLGLLALCMIHSGKPEANVVQS